MLYAILAVLSNICQLLLPKESNHCFKSSVLYLNPLRKIVGAETRKQNNTQFTSREIVYFYLSIFLLNIHAHVYEYRYDKMIIVGYA